MINNKIKLIVSFNNPGNFFDLCINNLLIQDYDNYEILFIDDFSSDGSYEKIPAGEYKKDKDGNPMYDNNNDLIIDYSHPLLEKTKCKNIIAWKSNNKNGNLINYHNAIINWEHDENDIFILIDGKDWLLNKLSLSQINTIYNATNCWMTFDGENPQIGKKLDKKIFLEDNYNKIRSNFFKFNSPITFRAGLYDKFCEIDGTLSLKDLKNVWYTNYCENIIAVPLIEMCGFEKIFQVDKGVYVKNNNLHEHISEFKLDVFDDILERKKLDQIKTYSKQAT